MASTATPRRRKDDAEFDAFACRVVRAYSRRAATTDPTVLATLARLAATVEQATADAVVALHGRGFSWADIGRELGIARQDAHRKWGPLVQVSEAGLECTAAQRAPRGGGGS